MGDVKVTVWSIVCKQSVNLERMLDSILHQNTNFDYEIVIQDGSEGGIDLLKEYQSKYPEKIRVIASKVKNEDVGVYYLPQYYADFRGEYIAWCSAEGYWTDTNKLQAQYDAMQDHQQCAVCATTGFAKNPQNDKPYDSIDLDTGEYDFDQAVTKAYYLPSSSLFFRKEYFVQRCESNPEFLTIAGGESDIAFLWFMYSKGNLYFLAQPMVVDKLGKRGIIVTHKIKESARVDEYRRPVIWKQYFGRFTDYKFSSAVNKIALYDEYNYHCSKGDCDILDKKYKSVREGMDMKHKMFTYCRAHADKIKYVFSKIINK